MPPISAQHASQRRHARRKALQALYQWDLTDTPAVEIERQFARTQDMSKADVDYFSAILASVTAHQAQFDNALEPFLDRDIDRLDPIERNSMRIAAFELLERADVPSRVVINEAVELVKLFGAEQGHKYVNGVLDGLARKARAAELSERSGT